MISKRDILEIACKVLGLLCLVHAIPYLASITYMNVGRGLLAFSISPFMLYLVSAFILLKWSKSIASRLVREDQPMELELDKERQKPLYMLSLRIVGAAVLIKAVPAVVGAVIQIIFRSRFSMTATRAWLSLISNIVYLALGVYFIGGAKEVVRIALRGSLRESDSDDS